MYRVAAVNVVCGLVLAGCLAERPTTRVRHELPDLGVAVELPPHFGQSVRSVSGAHAWSFNDDLTTFEIAPALPGDQGIETQPDTVMPGQLVDYAREAEIGGMPGRERRTQEPLGAMNRAVWTGFVEGPRGNLTLKLIMVQPESADEFGEAFWRNLTTNLIQRLE